MFLVAGAIAKEVLVESGNESSDSRRGEAIQGQNNV